MARVTKYKPLYPWNGGLATSIDPTILNPQNLVIADNIKFTNSTARKKRGGTARFNSTPAAGATSANMIYMIDYWATVSNAKVEYAVAIADNGTAHRATFSAATWSSFATSSLTVSHGGVHHTVINNDLVVGVRGATVPYTWIAQNTSSNLVLYTANSAALPFTTGWILQNYLERMWVAGDRANPDRVYVSSAGNHRGWTTGVGTAGRSITLQVGVGDGDPVGITAMMPSIAGERAMYVFKKRHVYKIDCSALLQDNWLITKLTDQIGCINPSAVKSLDTKDIVFLSDRGMHTLTQVVSGTEIIPSQDLSFDIQYDYQNIASSSDRDKISLVWYPNLNSIMFSCKRTGQSIFETYYLYNLDLKAWYRWTGTASNFVMKRLNPTTNLDELYACAPNGFVNKLEQTTLGDLGSPIVTRIKSAFIAPQDNPLFESQFTGLACFYRAHENSSFRCFYSIDGLNQKSVDFVQRIPGGNILGTTLLGSAFILGNVQSIKPVWNHLEINSGNSIQFTFEQDGLNEDLELFGLAIEYEVEEESQNAFAYPPFV